MVIVSSVVIMAILGIVGKRFFIVILGTVVILYTGRHGHRGNVLIMIDIMGTSGIIVGTMLIVATMFICSHHWLLRVLRSI